MDEIDDLLEDVNDPCHCGRALAITTASDDEVRHWVRDWYRGDSFWIEMATEFCEPCWQMRCDVEGECPAKWL